MGPDARAACACVDLSGLEEFLAGGPRQALQLVADHGRGKSTLLLALHRRRFASSPYTQLHAGDGPPSIASGPVQFIDSVENLSWWTRRRLYRQLARRSVSLACTTHRDLSRELVSAGFEVRTVQIGIRSVDELERIVHGRVRAAQMEPVLFEDPPACAVEPPLPPRERLEALYRTHGDDVRTIEHHLYLDYQRLKKDYGEAAARAGTPQSP